MSNQAQIKEKLKPKRKKINFKHKNQNKFNSPKDQIFRIVLTGILLGLSVAFSLIEIKIPIMGADIPLRIFDTLIMAIAIPIVGILYTLAIGIIEPWLHFALDSDHPPIQMFFDNIANIIFVLSFVVVFYKLFKLNKSNKVTNNKQQQKNTIIKNVFAGLILIPLNAIISSLAFVFTIIILANTNLATSDEYLESIAAFYKNGYVIFFILLAIEVARFLLIFILFALMQKKLLQLNKFQMK